MKNRDIHSAGRHGNRKKESETIPGHSQRANGAARCLQSDQNSQEAVLRASPAKKGHEVTDGEMHGLKTKATHSRIPT